jgi:hypothetical protein
MNVMNITAYAEEISFQAQGFANYLVIDDAASVGKKYPEVIGHVTVIRGYGHFVGDRYSAAKGVEAVIALSGGNSMNSVRKALQGGLKAGRDDRK